MTWDKHVRLSLCGAIAGHAIAVCLGASAESADLIAMPSAVITSLLLAAVEEAKKEIGE